MQYTPEQIAEALTVERLGGRCYFSICGAGETLFPDASIPIVKSLLENGHFVNVTTNGTLSVRFDQLLGALSEETCQRLHFAFSLHYLELERINKLEDVAPNVKKVKSHGCSYLVQLNLRDEYIPHIQQIKEYCMHHFGAYPQIAATRKENDLQSNVELLTDPSEREYLTVGGQFDSPLFAFTMKNFNVPRKEFCYAGDWAFTLNLATGLPCVSTDHTPGGARLLITDHEDGLLAPVQNANKLAAAMCEYVENPALAEKCGQNAKRVLQRFDPERIIDMWETYIKQIARR